MDEFAAYPIDTTGVNGGTGEEEIFTVHHEFDEESAYDVADAWEEFAGSIWDEDFSLDEFRKLARMTFVLLQPYFRYDLNEEHLLPVEYVKLLLAIQTFSNHPVDADKELAAAKLVAQGFIDQALDGCDEDPSTEDVAFFRFECWETQKTYDIDAETFDLSELIDDIEKMEEDEP